VTHDGADVAVAHIGCSSCSATKADRRSIGAPEIAATIGASAWAAGGYPTTPSRSMVVANALLREAAAERSLAV